MSDYKYPADLIKTTDDRIQAQIKGNGDISVSLTLKRQGLDKFTAHTDFTVDCMVETKEQTGKAQGGRTVDRNNLQSEIKKFTDNLKTDEKVANQVSKNIESLSLKGFGSDGEVIKLTGQAETFISTGQCNSCAGKGQSECRQCRGQGREQCPLCHYMGELDCMVCQGRGVIQYNDSQKQCTNCQGRGRVYCTNCNGQKTVPCRMCGAKGQIVCKTCAGKGETSLMTTVTPHAKTKSQINIQELDHDAKRMVSLVGAVALAKGGHIEVKTATPPDKTDKNDTAWYEENPKVAKPSGAYYTIDVPWAVTEIECEKKPYIINIIGKKGAVCEADPFMDAILAEPMDLMTNAAKGRGVVSTLLKDACAYRVSRETLISVIKGKTKQTMAEIQAQYKIGLSKSFIQNFVKATYIASKKITRRPRYIAMGVGILASGLLDYLWFMNTRPTAVNDMNTNIQYAIDGSILLAGMAFAYGLVKIAAYIAMRRVLSMLNIQIKKIPAAGKAGIYAIGLSGIVWAGFMAHTLI